MLDVVVRLLHATRLDHFSRARLVDLGLGAVLHDVEHLRAVPLPDLPFRETVSPLVLDGVVKERRDGLVLAPANLEHQARRPEQM